MARTIESNLIGDFDLDLTRYEQKIQEKVIFSGAASMAKTIYDEVKLNASGSRGEGFPGRKTGTLAESIYRVYSPERSGDSVKTYRISWNKKKAPHGHLIEFGTSRMAARPFIRPAFDHMGSAIRSGLASMKAELQDTGGSNDH